MRITNYELRDKISDLISENNELRRGSKAIGCLSDILQVTPIEIAKSMIGSTYDCESMHNGLSKRHTFNVYELREIANYLLVYCDSRLDNL